MATRPLAIRPSRAASDAQRRAWRRDRVRDGARLLPVLGLGLMLLPDLILSDSEAAKGATRPWGLYLFAAWAGLIVLAFWVARSVSTEPGAAAPAGSVDGQGGAPHDEPCEG